MDATSRVLLCRHLTTRIEELTRKARTVEVLGDPTEAQMHRCTARALSELLDALDVLTPEGRDAALAAAVPVPPQAQPCPVCAAEADEPHHDWCEELDARSVGVTGIEVEEIDPRNARGDGDDCVDVVGAAIGVD